MIAPPGAARCVRGSSGITELASITDKLQLAQQGRDSAWTFVPESISALHEARSMDDARTRLEWLVKTAPHRSVAPALSNGGGGGSAGEQLLQRRIDPPYLIDGRAWDLGVYVGFQRHDDG